MHMLFSKLILLVCKLNDLLVLPMASYGILKISFDEVQPSNLRRKIMLMVLITIRTRKMLLKSFVRFVVRMDMVLTSFIKFVIFFEARKVVVLLWSHRPMVMVIVLIKMWIGYWILELLIILQMMRAMWLRIKFLFLVMVPSY